MEETRKLLLGLFESFRFALQSLRGNLLRTVLSLLGVTIGIFSIAGVLTLVDSMERNIRNELNFLGDQTLYIQKWPWGGYSDGYEWWDFVKRPETSYREFQAVQENTVHAEAVSFWAKKRDFKLRYNSFSADLFALNGVSYPHFRILGLNPAKGRFFTEEEAENARPVMVVGHQIAENLFPNGDAVGRTLKIKGQKIHVIGVLPEVGEGTFSFNKNDEEVFLSYSLFAKLFATGDERELRPSILVKGLNQDRNSQKLEGELRGLMRGLRGLRPKEKDNFALNRPEMLTAEVQKIFAIISTGGWIIGSFSILVGAFGIANIMFVTVKERTPIIGIQKALGAKNYFILSQYLFEAVFLSLIGGAGGMCLVFLITLIPQDMMEIRMSTTNLVQGFSISFLTGLVAGFWPAYTATRMDPVEAIRR